MVENTGLAEHSTKLLEKDKALRGFIRLTRVYPRGKSRRSRVEIETMLVYHFVYPRMGIEKFFENNGLPE